MYRFVVVFCKFILNKFSQQKKLMVYSLEKDKLIYQISLPIKFACSQIVSFALHWPKTSASFGQNWSNSSTMKIEKYLINQPVIFIEKHATRRFVISIYWIYIECSICSLQHSAPANLHNPLLSSFSDHSFLLVPYNCLQHKNTLDLLNPPLLSRWGTHAVLNFEVIARSVFLPWSQNLQRISILLRAMKKWWNF